MSVIETVRGITGTDRLLYSGGADWRVVKRLTLAADIIEQRVINSQRASLTPGQTSITLGSSVFTLPQTLQTVTGSYNRTDGSGGLKLNPFGNLLLTGNLIVKLDRGGLRERSAPLLGVSYTF
jgi:hypothetical protein